ncbi:MAG: four helix bundle protein [Planctomycetales bacterium]|nr:four helix bundle protein [Planctomycetales bacterium]
MEVWKRSCNLAVGVYKLLRECRDYGLRDQMQRAAVSIASNIAEGSERSPKEFARFLDFAHGSVDELRTQLYIAARIELVTQDDTRPLVNETKEISRMLFGLKKSLKTEN